MSDQSNASRAIPAVNQNSDNLSQHLGQEQATTDDMHTVVPHDAANPAYPTASGSPTTSTTDAGMPAVSGGVAQQSGATQPAGTQQADAVNAPEASMNPTHEYEDEISGTGRPVVDGSAQPTATNTSGTGIPAVGTGDYSNATATGTGKIVGTSGGEDEVMNTSTGTGKPRTS